MANKYLDSMGVSLLWQKIKNGFQALQNNIDNKVDKVDGKALSSNDYTADEKAKLTGIAAGAEVNVNADWSKDTGDSAILNKPTKLSQFTNDGNFVTDASYVHTDNNLTAELKQKILDAGTGSFTGNYADLVGKPDLSQYQTETQVTSAINTAIASAYKYKGSVANEAALPTTGQVTGDIYNLQDTDMNVAWNGTAWDKLAPTIDLTPYLKSADMVAITETEINTICQ